MSASESLLADALPAGRARLPVIHLGGVPVIVAVADLMSVLIAALVADLAVGGGIFGGGHVFGGNAFIIIAAAVAVTVMLFGQHASVYSSRALLTGKVRIIWPVSVFALGTFFFAGLSLRESLSSSACRAATLSGSLVLARSRSSASSSMLSPDRLRCGLMCCDLLWG